mgnify:CR=1 FL=1
MKWEYLDELAALVLIVGCIVLLAFRIDGEVKSILAMAAAWAFKGGYDRTFKKGG